MPRLGKANNDTYMILFPVFVLSFFIGGSTRCRLVLWVALAPNNWVRTLPELVVVVFPAWFILLRLIFVHAKRFAAIGVTYFALCLLGVGHLLWTQVKYLQFHAPNEITRFVDLSWSNKALVIGNAVVLIVAQVFVFRAWFRLVMDVDTHNLDR